MKNKIWILAILATILCIGGCSTKSKEPTKEEQEAMKIEQDRMVEYLYTHYEDIKEVEFIEFKKNNKTGTWIISATVNKSIDIMLWIDALQKDSRIRIAQNSSKDNKLIEKSMISLNREGIKNIEVKYFKGEEKQ